MNFHKLIFERNIRRLMISSSTYYLDSTTITQTLYNFTETHSSMRKVFFNGNEVFDRLIPILINYQLTFT